MFYIKDDFESPQTYLLPNSSETLVRTEGPCCERLSLIRFQTFFRNDKCSASPENQNINCGLILTPDIYLCPCQELEKRKCPSGGFVTASESRRITPTCHYTRAEQRLQQIQSINPQTNYAIIPERVLTVRC